jgi:hypothetical protein
MVPRRVITLLVVATVGCGPFESVDRLPTFATLENRCVRLRQPLQIIESGNDGVSDLYLSNASHDDGASVGELAAGSELKIVRVVFKKGVELSRVEIVAEELVSTKNRRSIALSRLFNQKWLDEARRSASGRGAAPISSREMENALDPTLSEWSECGATR